MATEHPFPPSLVELFSAVLELDEGARQAYLEAHCADAAMRSEVLALCQADSQTGGTLDTPIERLASPLLPASPDRIRTMIGQRIGAYRITDLLGEGGMATVWLAERCDGSFDHQVAIKCLKAALAGPELERRFARERQILATLDHSGIARLLDGGISEDGVAYIVMERVEGEPLCQWCRAKNLSVTRCLQLFVEVCAAVQYAHQHLVVHRDLKPANILVNQEGHPRLLDFGVAGLLDGAAADQPDTRSMAMTPEYAAPEQWLGKSVGVAADVYALGVILCELLSGRRPAAAIQAGSRPEQVKMPSRLIMLPGDVADSSRKRRAHRVRGDLDAIVLKALREEPGQRYASAANMADDIERHLQHEPVLARRGNLAYRSTRFAQRHKGALAAMLLIAAVLSGALVQGIHQVRQTQSALAESQAVRAFLTSLFESNRPAGAANQLPTTRQLLDQGAARARNEFSDNPALRMRMLATIGGIYRQLGQYPQARGLLDEATSLIPQQTAEVNGELRLEIRRQVALLDADQGKLDAALRQLTDILAEQRQARARPGELATALRELGRVQSRLGHHQDAIALQREAVGILRHQPAADGLDFAGAQNDLGVAFLRAGDDEQAIDSLQTALAESLKVYGPLHEEVSQTRSNLAVALRRSGRYSEAEQLLREAVKADARIYTEPHADAAQRLNNLGTLLYFRDKPLEAEEILQRARAMNLNVFGEHHPETASTEANLALAEYGLGRYDKAVPLQRAALAQFIATYGARHNSVAITQNNLARSLTLSGEGKEARELAQQSLQLKQDLRGTDSDATAPALLTLAELDAQEGDPQSGLAKLDQLMQLKGIEERLDTPTVLIYQLAHARLLCQAKQWQLGLTEINSLLAQVGLGESEAPLSRADGEETRGDCLLGVGDRSQALLAWRRALDLRQSRLPEKHPFSQRLRVRLAEESA
jgi:eukaryotic-like serine/threonine-protein kinase